MNRPATQLVCDTRVLCLSRIVYDIVCFRRPAMTTSSAAVTSTWYLTTDRAAAFNIGAAALRYESEDTCIF